jgi:hypothetical protein
LGLLPVAVALGVVVLTGCRWLLCFGAVCAAVGVWLLVRGEAAAALAGRGPRVGQDVPWRQEGIADGVIPS